MLHNPAIQPQPATEQFLVAKFHSPRVAVIIPHFNYSDYLGDALLSVQQQTYGNFVCLVVDDQSTDEHYSKATNLVAALADARFKIMRNSENIGMVHSIYRGLDEIDAAFFCVLDPDDRYTADFLQRMLAAHLNPIIFAPVVSSDQFVLKIGDGILTRTYSRRGVERLAPNADQAANQMFAMYGFHEFVPPDKAGWHWSSTSAMMFRTGAAQVIRPRRKLAYKGNGDDWLASGTHMMGGSILLREPLVYRGMHLENDYMSSNMFSMSQMAGKPGAYSRYEEVKVDVVEAFLENGGLELFSVNNFIEVILAQFRGKNLSILLTKVPAMAEVLETKHQSVSP